MSISAFQSPSSLFFFFLLLLHGHSSSPDRIRPNETFTQCISLRTSTHNSNVSSQLIHTPKTSSYAQFLHHSLQNLRFSSPSTPKPVAIVIPTDASHVQSAVVCARHHGLTLRVRSGGHDYEGMSSRCNRPFVIVDMVKLNAVNVDLPRSVVWVESGATVGELYYRIAEKSKTVGFPAGICPSVGVGGHFGGGGFGTLIRKYGLAADNVVDARLVDANGRVLDRSSMGKDFFWTIRGGGAESFGIVLKWKVKLVPVPPTVTAFSVSKPMDDNAIRILHKWQATAPNLNPDLYVRAIIQHANAGHGPGLTLLFQSLYLGRCSDLLHTMNRTFPDLPIQPSDCKEMTWIQSSLHFSGLQNQPLESLLNRGDSQSKIYFKGKSDFVTQPISQIGWRGIVSKLTEEGAGIMIMEPLGGRMDEVHERETPFPHRKGNLYNIQYFSYWQERWGDSSEKHIEWIRRFYDYMTPYVSKDPRCAYFNYRDLDLGTNGGGGGFMEGGVWGRKYFKGNFIRLARVKGRVDPGNFFRGEQSIPPLFSAEETRMDGSVTSKF